MHHIHWIVQTFHQLERDQLYELLQLRVDVFVVEQHCAYPELDDHDRHAETRHLSGRDAMGQLIAYARVIPPGLSFAEVSIGRFVVKKEARGEGVGHQLLCEGLKEIESIWPGTAVKVSAQDYLQKFYERYGFVPVSEVYLDYGVPHITMVRKMLKNFTQLCSRYSKASTYYSVRLGLLSAYGLASSSRIFFY